MKWLFAALGLLLIAAAIGTARGHSFYDLDCYFRAGSPTGCQTDPSDCRTPKREKAPHGDPWGACRWMRR